MSRSARLLLVHAGRLMLGLRRAPNRAPAIEQVKARIRPRLERDYRAAKEQAERYGAPLVWPCRAAEYEAAGPRP
jgi:hypothetical protein